LQLQPPRRPLAGLTVKLGDRILLIKPTNLVAAEAEDKYVWLYTTDGKRHLTEYSLTDLEASLPGDFLRIHRSTLINAERIGEIRKGFNGSYTFVMEAMGAPRFKSSRSSGGLIRTRFGI